VRERSISLTRKGLILLPLELVVDLALAAATVVAVAIMLTGGGEIAIHGIRVSLLRARNPLTAALALALIRLALHDTGLLPGSSSHGLPARTARLATRMYRRLLELTPAAALRALSILLFVCLLLRLANAWYYYGFFSGDDVEVHEMTFATLFGRDVTIWGLRSPFFPMAFIFPAQRLALALGFGGTDALVFVGRAVVAGWSCIGVAVMYMIGRRLLGGAGAGILAALFLAVMRLHVRFGSSELPRPVAATFLLVAFGLLVAGRRTVLQAGLAGAVLGIAAAIRFSEAAFVLPLTVQLLVERRFRALLVALLAAGAALAVTFGVGDQVYWGHPFHALRNIVDYTLVQRASSSGQQPFQPLHHYVTTALLWSNACMLGLFAAGAKREWRAALWALLPILALSALPHKEEGYLVPLLPFVALVAAGGAWRLLAAVSVRGRERWAPYLLLLLAGALLLELEGARFRRSEGSVDVARYLARADPCATIAIEQAWRAGYWLYLRDAQVIDLDPQRMAEAGYLQGILQRAHYVMLRPHGPAGERQRELLQSAGFRQRPVTSASRSPDLLYERVGPARSAVACVPGH
jgi:hypothetical protein